MDIEPNKVFDDLMKKSWDTIAENPELKDYKFTDDERDAIDLGIAVGIQSAFVWWNEVEKDREKRIDALEERYKENYG